MRGGRRHGWLVRHGGGGAAWGWVFVLLVVAGTVAVALALLALLDRPSRGRESVADDGRARARQILDERFARGEIEFEDYRQRVRQLEGP